MARHSNLFPDSPQKAEASVKRLLSLLMVLALLLPGVAQAATCKEHVWVSLGTTYPTCTKAGLEKCRCKRCGKIWSQEIPALGHYWVTLSVTEEATCTQTGTRRVRCSSCGTTGTKKIPALGHTWVDSDIIVAPTCMEEGVQRIFCQTCGEADTKALDMLPHSFGPWTIVEPATLLRDGVHRRSCSLCGEEETDVYAYDGSYVEIITTAGKVNLRTEPGVGKRLAATVARKNTSLGMLLGTAIGEDGVVWYKVKYKGRECWVTSAFAKASRANVSADEERLPIRDSVELSGYFHRSLSACADDFALTRDAGSSSGMLSYSNEHLSVSGLDYVESIAVLDTQHTLFGLHLGDNLDKAYEIMLHEYGAYCVKQSESVWVFYRPCALDALYIDDKGFDSYLEVTFSEDDLLTRLELHTSYI